MAEQKTIAFFPEGAFGPALNSVGIAQACRDLGHRAVFICDPGSIWPWSRGSNGRAIGRPAREVRVAAQHGRMWPGGFSHLPRLRRCFDGF